MRGHIRQRGANSYELKLDIGRDAEGRRRIEYHTVRGSKRQAQQKLAELLTAVGKGAHVARSVLSVGEHVAERIGQWQALGKVTPKTAQRYGELFRNQIAPYLGGIALQHLKAADIERWHATLKTAGRKDGRGGLSALTIRHAHRLLSKTLKEAARHDLVIRNAAAGEPPPKVVRQEIVILTDEQVRAVVTSLAAAPIYPQIIIALFTAMRRGEILALRWQHVDLDGKIIRVRSALEETKAGLRFKMAKSDAGQRDIALPDIVVDVLRDFRRQQLQARLALGAGKLTDDMLLFARLNGAPLSPNSFSKAWAKLGADIGLADITFHALRHTHASHLVDAGVDVVRISKRLGHAMPSVTLNVYSHLFARREDKSATVINDAVVALLSAR